MMGMEGATMKSYDSTTRTLEQQPIPGPAQDAWGILVYATVASVAIVLGGTLFLSALNMLAWELLRLFVAVASLPWVFVGALLILATWKQGVALLERLTNLDLDDSGEVGDVPDIRLVPVRGPSHTVGGVAPEDWRYFVETICAVPDWTQRTWRGQLLPSKRKCDNEYWSLLTGGLKRVGVIAAGGERSTGHLTTTDAAEILDMLGV